MTKNFELGRSWLSERESGELKNLIYEVLISKFLQKNPLILNFPNLNFGGEGIGMKMGYIGFALFFNEANHLKVQQRRNLIWNSFLQELSGGNWNETPSSVIIKYDIKWFTSTAMVVRDLKRVNSRRRVCCIILLQSPPALKLRMRDITEVHPWVRCRPAGIEIVFRALYA
jgi:hypothetical protein